MRPVIGAAQPDAALCRWALRAIGRETIRRIAITLVIGIVTVTATTGCFYSSASVNLRDFEARGVSTKRTHKRETRVRDTRVQNYGRVHATERSWIFGSCDEIAERALSALLAEGVARGGNRVLNTQFRGHWRWMQEPVCRRNLAYLLLIVPALFPVATSVTVYGEAVYDPAQSGRGAARAMPSRSPSTPNRTQIAR